MGQAKRRGSFEQRQAEGIARRAREDQEREEAYQRRLGNMTPTERKKQRDTMMLLAAMMGAAMPNTIQPELERDFSSLEDLEETIKASEDKRIERTMDFIGKLV